MAVLTKEDVQINESIVNTNSKLVSVLVRAQRYAPVAIKLTTNITTETYNVDFVASIQSLNRLFEMTKNLLFFSIAQEPMNAIALTRTMEAILTDREAFTQMRTVAGMRSKRALRDAKIWMGMEKNLARNHTRTKAAKTVPSTSETAPTVCI